MITSFVHGRSRTLMWLLMVLGVPVAIDVMWHVVVAWRPLPIGMWLFAMFTAWVGYRIGQGRW